MTGIVALACFATGFVTAWLTRTGFAMTQLSWTQERMERKVRYWKGEALYARTVAGDALRQLADITGRVLESPDWPELEAEGQQPGGN